ncbi:MAG: hypothetical protein IT379_36255, partial [Deltaproteobacteria bacterium]|nr:hypothetical protein [Deltaproteobacteria bacterium]
MVRTRELSRLGWYVCLLGVVLAGCSHELDGPSPRITAGLSPHLVCNQQLTTRVAITGEGFSPMPVDTATEPAVLLLPTLSLTHTLDLAGEPGGGDVTTLSGDPREETMHPELVRWTSQSAMAFDVVEPLALAEGIWDLAIENPNGHDAQPLSPALAVVPPPVLERIEPMAICLDQFDVMLRFVGTGFLDVDGTLPTVTFTATDGDTTMTYTPTEMTGCETLPAPATETQRCTGMVVVIPQDDLPVGTYGVVVTNPEPAHCQSTEEIVIEVVPPPDVTGVMPRRLCTGGGTIGVLGTGFRDGATVRVDDLEASMVTVGAGGTSATATFGAGLDPGTYAVTLTNPEGCEDTLADAVEVVEGPILFWVDPPVVFNGIATQITLYGSGFSTDIAGVQIVPAGGASPAIDLAFTLDGTLGRIQAVVPSGTAAGSYDVVVQTLECPAVLPAGLQVTDALTLTPSRIEPPFGHAATATPVTIFGAGFVQEPRGYLNPQMPTPTTVASPIGSVAVSDPTRLTGVVRSGLPPGVYDLIVVNPDGAVGLLDDAFTVTADPPPVIETVSPGELDAGGVFPIDVTGSGFRSPTATWSCRALDGTASTPAGTVSG